MTSVNGVDKALEEPEGMETEAHLLKDLAQIPAISSAWVGKTSYEGNQVTVQYAQRDLGGNKLKKYLRTFHLPAKLPDDSIQAELSFPIELRDVLLHSVSPSGKKQLVVRASKEGDSMVLELWSGSRITAEVQVPKDLHGKIYNDNWFGTGASWNADETRIAYVAEEPTSVKTPDWGQAGQPGKVDSTLPKGQEKPDEAQKPEGTAPKAGPKSWRGVGEFQEDWGELNTGKKVPKLFVIDVATGSVLAVKGLPAENSTGQPVWTPDSKGLIFVAWPHKAHNFPGLPQRLGIVYCVNRPCFLYHVQISVSEAADTKVQEAEKLETGLQMSFCPQFSPSGNSLVFMSHNAAVTSGAHCASVTLESLPWPAKGPRKTLVGLVGTPEDEFSFPGLHSFLLSRVPFAFVSDDRLLVTTHWRSFLRIIEVSVSNSPSVAAVSPVNAPAPCWILLAVAHGVVVATKSGPRQPPSLVVARTDGRALQWHDVCVEDDAFGSEVAEFLRPEQEAYKVFQVQPSIGPKVPCEAVLLINKEGKKNAPTVLFLHGGPHTAFAAAHILSNAFLNLVGYNVLQVNYRGSLGFGEDSVQSLLGHVGTNDVADCLASLDAAIKDGWVDPDKVAIIGGSHGGFLVGHLVGQHPDRFKAGVLRNPVLDLGLMTQISDIPDWCFIEAFGSQEGLKKASPKPSLEELKQLTEKSPIHHIDRVRAPLFFMLGAKDRRVNMRDAHQYVAALRAREGAPEARVIVFPDDAHGLEQPQTEFEQWLNAAWWLRRFL